ncbi:MAG: UDP-N-acetylmuramate--L-alanine ligase [Chloroflexota bacterium]|nr:UDP-N-acetylmuramate--L-alanine ligase [Chloroflexota bacterium]
MSKHHSLRGQDAEIRVHLIGIGGAGLSAIATVLLERGCRVSGSDLRSSANTQRLQEMGAQVYIGHDAEQVGEAQAVIVSSAIPEDNVELMAARARDLPVLKRDQVFGWLTADSQCVAVAGTHGKTTTAAMITWILLQAGRDPSLIVGGEVMGLGANARAGQGEHFVVEADEYDNAFLGLTPRLAVVTHLELDHPDCFPDLEAMTAAFRAFLQKVEPQGAIIGCGDAPNVEALLRRMRGGMTSPQVITYGLVGERDWVGRDGEANGQGGMDFVAWHGQDRLGRVRLSVPGTHNVRNALGALAAAQELGVSFDRAREALATFQGTKRRFEVKGRVGGVIVVDDYAHHPTQIRATLAAARERYGARELWAVFQPHTYSRTKALLDEFAASFEDADQVIVTDIYAAREFDDLGVSGADIVARMDHPDARYIADLDGVVAYLLPRLKPGDVLLTLGAGDGYKVGEGVLAELGGKG